VETVTRRAGSRSPGRKKKTYVIRRVKHVKVSTLSTEPPESPGAPTVRLSPEQRYLAIAEAAYYKAESRGFQGGDPAQDWREAEAEIDAWILGSERGD